MNGTIIGIFGWAITFLHENGRTYNQWPVAQNAVVTLDGRQVKLDELREGDIVEVSGQPAVSIIAARPHNEQERRNNATPRTMPGIPATGNAVPDDPNKAAPVGRSVPKSSGVPLKGTSAEAPASDDGDGDDEASDHEAPKSSQKHAADKNVDDDGSQVETRRNPHATPRRGKH